MLENLEVSSPLSEQRLCQSAAAMDSTNQALQSCGYKHFQSTAAALGKGLSMGATHFPYLSRGRLQGLVMEGGWVGGWCVGGCFIN